MGTHTQDVTVVGWVGSNLRTYHLDGVGGVPYAQFRLASTRRVLDRQSGAFRDGPTLWFTVKAWRAAAVNLDASLAKGDPVVVVGRLGQSEWVAQDGAPRSELVLEALAVGHDLSFGTTKFRRTLSGPRRARDDHADALPDDVGGLAEAPGPGPVHVDDPWASTADAPPAGDEPPADESDVAAGESACDLGGAAAPGSVSERALAGRG
ncbi:single-stranded DNA-binding protein [Cellulomonas xiejunii]|uniref:Single-stranded DNA-binding protein n=1 Tax=Cellulomonas xiejunii TaxID=2968083 RepID=A0ABY5KTR9_9CELL|nr:single-stranded DNA-binding protein [Cellulomonas xiejunii]MCC2321824.1 single-stranded DNA-binding protein [Cellulomonas xiejunii]UUI73128.1 single-stranded DNA-binding protein [Cellulomonas xiejunii]